VMRLEPDDYYKKLLYIFSHPKEAERMAEKGKQYTRKHLTLEVYAQKIEEAIWKLQ